VNSDDIIPGVLVTASYGGSVFGKEQICITGVQSTGIVVKVEHRQTIFSEKYAITETSTAIHVLCDGNVSIYYLEEDSIEVVKNED
jgi:hypothetical protein